MAIKLSVTKKLIGILCCCAVSLSGLAATLTQSEIKTMLVNEAVRQGISPALVLAIAKVESDFNPLALSHAGAKGVMQIMPATALNGFSVVSHQLYQPEVNIRVGVAYIKQLLEQYQGDVDIALSHYNGGSAVKHSNGELRVIPATRNYVNKVRQYVQHYQKEGYAGFSPEHKTSLIAGTASLNDSALPYARQMALDNEVRNTSTAVTEIDTVVNESRIDQLQQLRVHNLTRILGAKSTKPQLNLAAPPEDHKLKTEDLAANNWQKSAAQMRSYREVFAASQAPEQQLKQQKVASWEAIFTHTASE